MEKIQAGFFAASVRAIRYSFDDKGIRLGIGIIV